MDEQQTQAPTNQIPPTVAAPSTDPMTDTQSVVQTGNTPMGGSQDNSKLGPVGNNDDSSQSQQQPQSATQADAQKQNQQGQQSQQQDVQGRPLGQPPSLNQPPAKPYTSVPPGTPNSDHPLVKDAGVMNSMAIALMGGRQYKTTIDPMTGTMKRTPVPVSRGDVGMAIAMTAIRGALAGLGQSGPNHLGKAAMAGLEQGQQIQQQRQQQQQQEDERATQDFARQAQVFETNLRTYQIAQTLGRQDYDQNAATGAQYKPLADQIQKQFPQAIKGVVSESQLAQYHITKDNAIPTGKVVPRLNPPGSPNAGEQAKGPYGNPLWDHEYMVVDPSVVGSGFLSDKDRATAKKYGMAPFVNNDGSEANIPQDLSMKLGKAINYKAQLTTLQNAESEYNDYFSALNKSHDEGKPVLNVTPLKNTQYQPLIDTAAQKYGVPVALARAVVNQESGGNQMGKNGQVLTSPKGAMGIMQLIPSTATAMGVQDPTNPQQNIEGGMKYLGQLFQQYKGDIPLTLAAYNAGPGNVHGAVPNFPETKAYVANITNALKTNPQQDGGSGGGDQTYQPGDLVSAIKGDPSLVDSFDSFTSLLNATGGNISKAIGELGKKDPQGAAKILNLYGGTSQVNHYDQMKLDEEAKQKKASELQASVDEQRALIPVKAAQTKADENARLDAKEEHDGVTNSSVIDYFNSDPAVSATIKPENVGPDGINHSFLQTFSQKNPQLGSLVDQIIHGKNLTGKYGLAKKDGQLLDAAVAAATGGQYDKNEAEKYNHTVMDFRPGGNMGKALVNASTAFDHLANLNDSVDSFTSGAVPGFKTLGDWFESDKSGSYATSIANAPQELGSLYANGGAAHENDVQSYRDAYNGPPSKVKSAVRQQAINAMDKVQELADAYYGSVPKTFDKPQTFLSTRAANNYTRLTGRQVDPKLVNWHVPAGAPPSQGVQNGQVLYQNGQPVAKAQDGQWMWPDEPKR